MHLTVKTTQNAVFVMKANSGRFRSHKGRGRETVEMPELRPPIIETLATIVTRKARIVRPQRTKAVTAKTIRAIMGKSTFDLIFAQYRAN